MNTLSRPCVSNQLCQTYTIIYLRGSYQQGFTSSVYVSLIVLQFLFIVLDPCISQVSFLSPLYKPFVRTVQYYSNGLYIILAQTILSHILFLNSFTSGRTNVDTGRYIQRIFMQILTIHLMFFQLTLIKLTLQGSVILITG